MKKKTTGMRLCLCMLAAAIAFSGCSSKPAESASTTQAAATYIPGTYSATEFGMNGDVTVTMTFDEESITEVVIVGDDETPGIGSEAVDQLPAAILEAQQADVDVISGATVTSDAIKAAAATCILIAKGEAVEESVNSDEQVKSADVIVVGAGAAGLSAASAAADAGASVIVLEANGRAGGAASLSAGNINCLSESVLKELGRNDSEVEVYLSYTEADFPAEYADDLAKVQEDVTAYLADRSITSAYDSVERIMLDHYIKGSGQDWDGNWATLNYDYIRKAVEANEDIVQWLLDDGITFKEASSKHFISPTNGGNELATVLLQKAENAGAIFYYNTRATELLTDESGRVYAVSAETEDGTVTFTANKGVVLATGGFSANPEMVVQYQRIGTGITTDIGSTNPSTNVGDGIVMAESVGAELYDMQFVGFMWRCYRALGSSSEANTLGTAKQLAVNADGVRFTNDTGNNLLNAVMDQPNAVANMVGDKAMYDAIEAATPGLVADLEDRGVLFMGDTLEEAAEKAGLDSETLIQTVENFNAMVDSGKDTEFGRTEFNGKVLEAPFIIAKCQAAAHLTYGGVATDLDAQVLRADGSVIDGLYAAGDVVAGYEGYAHQTGECLTTCMYYGQVAGQNAAK